LLIDKWDSIRSIKSEFDSSTKKFVLEKIAFLCHDKGEKHFTFKQIEKVCNEHRDFTSEKTNRLVNELIFRSSLIRTKDRNTFVFVHLSFQEYFTACYIFKNRDDKKVVRLLFNQWWVNTLKFYFGLIGHIDTIKFSEKRAEGKGHILIEYLNEAEYSKKETKSKILSIFGKQLLQTNGHDANSLKIFKENFRTIIPAMKKQLNSKFTISLNINYFILLQSIGKDGLEFMEFSKYELPYKMLSRFQDFVLTNLSHEAIEVQREYIEGFNSLENIIKSNNSYISMKDQRKIISDIKNQRKKLNEKSLPKKFLSDAHSRITSLETYIKRKIKNSM